MEGLSPYEVERLKSLEENRRVLRELGLLERVKPPVIRRKTIIPAVPKKRSSVATNGITSVTSNEYLKSHKSIRTRSISRCSLLAGEDTESENDSLSTVDFSEDETTSTHSGSSKLQRPNFYGAIKGIAVGTTWETRLQCAADGVHRPPVAGIHGGDEGAYSIALSGGYEDDVDFGEGFTYTGSGGRDLKGTVSKPKNLRTAPQSKDQTLHGVNASLAASVKSKLPIRVIRGFKLPSVYAPEEGYRYDGLYTAEKFWFATGMSGFKVIKYALKRLDNQDPPPWNEEQLDVLETQPRNVSPMEDMNITKENHTRIKINQTDSTNESPELTCKLPDIKSESPSPGNVINTTYEKKTPSKSHELKQNSSPKSSLRIIITNCDDRNGTNLFKNEISLPDKKTPGLEQNLQDKKMLKTPIKTQRLKQNLSSGNSSVKKVVNSFNESFKNPQENEVDLHNTRTPRTSLKILDLESKFSSRNSSAKKDINSLRENGFIPQENKINAQDKKPIKTPELARDISSGSSAIVAVSSVHKNEISPNDKKTPGLERNLLSKNSSPKKVVNSQLENSINPQENELGLHDMDTFKAPLKTPTNKLESEFPSRNSSMKKVVNSLHKNGFKPQEKKISSKDKKTFKTPLTTPGLERDNSRRSSIKNIVTTLRENAPNSQNSKINLPIENPSQIFPQIPELEQNLPPRSSSRKKIVNSPRENGSNDKDEVEQLDKKSKIPSKAHELYQNYSLKRPKIVGNTYKNEPDVQFISDLENKGNVLKLDEKLTMRNYKNSIARKVINISPKNDDKQRYNSGSETSSKFGNKLNLMTNSSPEITPEKPVIINYNGLCKHCLKAPSLESENQDHSNEYKPFLKLPGQTTILKYFKPNASTDILRNNKPSEELYNFKTNEPKVENKDTESPKKKILNNKDVVVAKLLRGNRRPSLYMDNNFNFSPDSPECVASENSPNKSVITTENVSEHNLNEHEIENMHSSKRTSKSKEGDKLVSTYKKRKSTFLIDFDAQEKIPSVQLPKNIQNIESSVITPHKQETNKVKNKRLHSPDEMSPDLSPKIRGCYVKLMKLSESEFSNFSGWDDDSDKYFAGFTDTDGKNGKLKQTQFGNVFTSLIHTCKMTVSPKYMKNKSSNTWPGRDMIQSPSIVVNGLLIDKYSNKS